MKKIILIGMPGCGKTSIGKIAAMESKSSFIDLDELITETHGLIPEIFKREGEEGFRNYETEALYKAIAGDSFVISAGGGIIVKQRNRDVLKNHNVIFIDRDISDILMSMDPAGRPLLKDNIDKIHSLFENRYPIYMDAMNFHVKNNGTERECIEKVKSIILNSMSE